MSDSCEKFGVTEIVRSTCGTCGKEDCKVASIPTEHAEITLCSDCLVDLANLVFESEEA